MREGDALKPVSRHEKMAPKLTLFGGDKKFKVNRRVQILLRAEDLE